MKTLKETEQKIDVWIADHQREGERIRRAIPSPMTSIILLHSRPDGYTASLPLPHDVLMFISEPTLYHILTDAIQYFRGEKHNERDN